MNLNDIAPKKTLEPEDSVRFFNDLWNALDVPIYKNTEDRLEDLHNPFRRMLPEQLTDVVMKAMAKDDTRIILFKTKQASFTSESLPEAKNIHCDEDDCCTDRSDLECLFFHNGVGVNGIFLDGAGTCMMVDGMEEHLRPLFNDVDILHPARILMLLSGNQVASVENDGEIHLTQLAF